MNFTKISHRVFLLVIGIGFAVSGFSQSFLTNGLVGYYPFNGNALDASGNGNNCIVNGAQLAPDRFGNPSSSYSFTGTNEYVATTNSIGFPSGTNDFSISVWVALSFLPTNDAEIVFCNAVVNDFQFNFYPITATTTRMDFWLGENNVFTATVSWVPMQWYNVQFVRSQNVVTMYRDGLVIGQNQTANGVNASPLSDYLQFGLGVPPQMHQFYGQLDDIRVYDRALSTNDVQQLYQYEASPPPSSLTTGLIAYYPFDGNANDQTTNANNGTPNGAVLTPDRFGQANGAYAFNGTSAYISAPNQSYLTFPNRGDFTMSVWATIDATPNPSMRFAGMDNGPGPQVKWLFAYGQLSIPTPPTGNYVAFAITDSAGVGYWLGPALYSPTPGSWHQYLVTKAGTTYQTYIDGVLASNGTNYVNYAFGQQTNSTVGPASIPSGITAPLTIGEAENGGWMNGKLDDVRIYDRALSASEVQQLYAIEAPLILNVQKAVYLDSSNLQVGTNYQVQVSTDLNTWTNYGTAFTATNSSWRSVNYFDVPNWDQLFFRLQAAP